MFYCLLNVLQLNFIKLTIRLAKVKPINGFLSIDLSLTINTFRFRIIYVQEFVFFLIFYDYFFTFNCRWGIWMDWGHINSRFMEIVNNLSFVLWGVMVRGFIRKRVCGNASE